MKFRSTASPAVLKSGKADIHCLTLLYCSRYVRTSGGCGAGCAWWVAMGGD